MKSSAFENVIIDALSAVDYIDTKDNRRFLSAVQDLSLDHPKERKYVQYYVDDRYLEICKAALHCDSEQLQPISQKAADYVRQEYANDGQWNDTMSEALARAFYLYGKKAKAPVSASDTQGVPEKPGEPEQQKQSERPEIPNRPEGSTEPEGPVREFNGGKKKNRRKSILIIAVIALAIAGGAIVAAGNLLDNSDFVENGISITVPWKDGMKSYTYLKSFDDDSQGDQL